MSKKKKSIALALTFIAIIGLLVVNREQISCHFVKKEDLANAFITFESAIGCEDCHHYRIDLAPTGDISFEVLTYRHGLRSQKSKIPSDKVKGLVEKFYDSDFLCMQDVPPARNFAGNGWLEISISSAKVSRRLVVAESTFVSQKLGNLVNDFSSVVDLREFLQELQTNCLFVSDQEQCKQR